MIQVRLFFFCAVLSGFAANADAAVTRIERITVTVADLARTEQFYRDGLGFEKVGEATLTDPTLAQLLGVKNARLRVLTMRLGTETVEFVKYQPKGRPYPADSRSPDRWFQHFAIIVSDMGKAYQRLKRVRFTPISTGGPQTLPPANGSVQAFKFRDPDRHPLELLFFPPGQGRAVWHEQPAGKIFLGIDHSAIGISDTRQSREFYTGLLGMSVAYEVLNRGSTQENLDGTFNTVVQITGLRPTQAQGPGVEFLAYRTPPTGRPAPVDVESNDIQHVHLDMVVDDIDGLARTLWDAGVPFVSPGVVQLKRGQFHKALMVRDPDGHALLLEQ